MIDVQHLTKQYGPFTAVHDVSFRAERGEILGFLGPNGAGKTTLFNCLSRLYVPNQGDILFEGRSILRSSRHAIAQIGIGRTFQNVALFDRMSVLDNVKVGCHSKSSTGFITNALRLPHWQGEESRINERAQELEIGRAHV